MSVQESLLPFADEAGRAAEGRIVVRTANRGDLDAIMEIERASFSTPWSESAMAQEIEGRDWSRVAVAVAGNRVAGFMVYWEIVDEVHLLNFAVHPAARRHGVGRAMMGRLVTGLEAEGCSSILLEVRVSNHVAQRLYRSFGFAPVSRRVKYYCDNNEDAIVMCLRRR